jgi:hypothetical protein
MTPGIRPGRNEKTTVSLQWVEYPMVRAWILQLSSRPMPTIILSGFDFQTVHWKDGLNFDKVIL